MSNGGGSSRVPIPNNVRKIIQNIREITGKQHTDDEIHAILRECSMDPNETAQKLLHIDTFHEVRRRRDRKKGLSSRALEDSRLKQGGQGRGRRGTSTDGGGARNLAGCRENGVNHIAERGHEPSTQSDSGKTQNNTTLPAIRISAVASNGPVNQSNGSSVHGFADQSFIGGGISVSKNSSAANDTNNVENVLPQAAVASAFSPSQTSGSGSVTNIYQEKSLSSSDQLLTYAYSTSVSGVYSSSLDPVPTPSITQNSGAYGAINREVGNQCISTGPSHVKGNNHVLHDVELPSPESKKYGSMDTENKNKAPNKSNEVEKNQLSETSQLSSSLSCNGSLRSSSCCDSQSPVSETVNASEACVQSSTESRQHVTFPNHFLVPEALKTCLTFGSFDNFGPRERSSSGTGGDNNTSAALESSPGSDETATSSKQRASLTGQGDHVDYPRSPSYLVEETPALGNSMTVSDTNGVLPKQEVVLALEGPPLPNVQSDQNYGLNFMSTMLGTQQVQFEGSESQAQETSCLPNFVSASPQVVPSPSPTSPLQSSIPVPPQSLSIFRPPYHPSLFPYGPYYPPIYVSPIHQFFSLNGFPQQPSVGNMHLPAAAAAAAGIKFPLPQLKAGANTENTAHIGFPSGSFISPPVGYAPSPTVNSGSTTGNEDLAVSQLKENQIYTPGQLSEGPAVWIPALGQLQDISSLQVNSMYSLTPQGHLTCSQIQNGHGAFAGIYQPGQAVASPPTLLQQSQAVAGAVLKL